ncbi:MAG: BrnA antitoxin family protein [Brasilonema octagenarum HA4186-MV1]|uniref:BrnA antitoxin of type II toxin-antitoxin system n=2 Tax=Brasilonema TaxID=383614 RepID=A0A856MJH8_9CYAN|nr:BrnA antitoxin family protein [Brasilonema octagenarum HA4186-MV1]NMF62536.1 hypothetical protein [Brasilonema octagenarum UFV-OR1]QDL09781.1 hypothetical protein DP114_19455 [Brasilonema sennae CENA114]QDL16134.1 hypothetical protein DP113_19380 [Brasilonema octagenarum UFV-E1]
MARVLKVSLNMRLDADVVAWLKNRQSRGYQTLINFVLREYMLKHQSEAVRGVMTNKSS